MTAFNLETASESSPPINPALIAEAAQRLAQGGLVAFPTETVYGLGADASNPQAVSKIYALKGRPSHHPLIVHIAPQTELNYWAINVPHYAHTLMKTFWPGPLSLILPRAPRVSDWITGGQNTVGLRCPSHPHAQALLSACAKAGIYGVAAPSANRFGHISPTTAAHVTEEFGPQLLVIDAGPCTIGIESTIVDCSGMEPVLLRPGSISREQIKQAIGRPVQERHASSPRVSGSLPAHYQPHTPTRLWHPNEEFSNCSSKTGLFAFQKPKGFEGFFIPAPSQPDAYAQTLYASLRNLDAAKLQYILIQAPPEDLEWEAINDRLQRACAPHNTLQQKREF